MLSPAHAPTQVRPPGTHRVAQVFASALPVAYSHVGFADWEPFARLVLRASYEATLAMAACRSVQHASGQRVTVYLTALGGGTFGDEAFTADPNADPPLTPPLTLLPTQARLATRCRGYAMLSPTPSMR